jgi:hypothetical protein
MYRANRRDHVVNFGSRGDSQRSRTTVGKRDVDIRPDPGTTPTPVMGVRESDTL